ETLLHGPSGRKYRIDARGGSFTTAGRAVIDNLLEFMNRWQAPIIVTGEAGRATAIEGSQKHRERRPVSIPAVAPRIAVVHVVRVTRIGGPARFSCLLLPHQPGLPVTYRTVAVVYEPMFGLSQRRTCTQQQRACDDRQTCLSHALSPCVLHAVQQRPMPKY